MTELLHKELTSAIIGAYYEVYNHTSRIYPEHIYERAMMEEVQRRGYPAWALSPISIPCGFKPLLCEYKGNRSASGFNSLGA